MTAPDAATTLAVPDTTAPAVSEPPRRAAPPGTAGAWPYVLPCPVVTVSAGVCADHPERPATASGAAAPAVPESSRWTGDPARRAAPLGAAGAWPYALPRPPVTVSADRVPSIRAAP
ncbi:hypothetical protein NX794_28300 [Streptomyces sp. LP11]|uniref:Uncharacterized protein n=1 Tax=Streptomyces pyxinicus TaxID=2970331 RepID=A0ABT2B990_9ACTN|nr:hypothetical protein [Streptomyces sp. LP11]MCS0605081.1 hypothetical protein [Streptomyces sp. LP11]